MKRYISLFLLIILLVSSLFAGGFEDSKKYDIDSIKNIDVSLLWEDITVSAIPGNTIYIISETKDKSLFPVITAEDKNLIIRNADYQFDKKKACHISLMLPEQYVADKVQIKNSYGNLKIQKLMSKTVILEPGPENLLENIKTDYLEIPMPDEADINISNLDCDQINIYLIIGSINLSMSHIPSKNSKISTKEGKINISLPKDESFTVDARSDSHLRMLHLLSYFFIILFEKVLRITRKTIITTGNNPPKNKPRCKLSPAF